MRKIIVLTLFLGLGGCGTMVDFWSPPPVYVVFFPDHDVTLTPDARKIVDHAAADARAQGAEMVQIAGPDTHMAPGYDPSIAQTRMHVVEQALLEEGVSQDRLVQTSLTTADLDVKHDKSGEQRVEIRLVDRPDGPAS
jgi:outer membrane protein OmpA-like peptidoglycan-associated protein